jgi:hypothetical protein
MKRDSALWCAFRDKHPPADKAGSTRWFVDELQRARVGCELDRFDLCALFGALTVFVIDGDVKGKLPPQRRARLLGEAVRDLEWSCSAGIAEGCHLWGALYEDGRLVPKDHARATQAFDKACSLGETAACFDGDGMCATRTQ